ncbi:MAG: oligosaccharide flippase family protein, partial [Chitinophagales bacterium]|nr:oligosaccharide flippase family protein [Chitinophagales bacterium]
MEGFKSFFKDTIIYGIASVLPRVITFGLVAVHTMVFQTNEFSFMTVWYVYAAFINVILTLGMETSFFRFYTAETNKKDVISTAYTILMVSSLIFLLIGFLFSDSLNSFFHFEDPRFLPLLMGTTVLDTLVVIPFAYLRVKGRPLRFMLVKLINIIALAIITILFLLIIPQYFADGSSTLVKLGLVPEYFKPEVVHIFYANVAASLITLLILLPELRYISIRIDKNICKKLINYGTPIMIGGIAYIINESADKLMIPKMIGENANGIYAASYKLGVFMVLYIT